MKRRKVREPRLRAAKRRRETDRQRLRRRNERERERGGEKETESVCVLPSQSSMDPESYGFSWDGTTSTEQATQAAGAKFRGEP